MTKTEKIGRLFLRMQELGFTPTETMVLLRCERVLHRWAELECGAGDAHIERDETTGQPWLYNARARYLDPSDPRRRGPIPDREASAIKRIKKIMEAHPPLWWYHQTDPRGCSLYVGRVKDVADGSRLDRIYSSIGTAVCI